MERITMAGRLTATAGAFTLAVRSGTPLYVFIKTRRIRRVSPLHNQSTEFVREESSTALVPKIAPTMQPLASREILHHLLNLHHIRQFGPRIHELRLLNVVRHLFS